MRIRPQYSDKSLLLAIIVHGLVVIYPPTAAAQDRHATANDTAMFAAVVRSIQDSVHMGRLLIDPRAAKTVEDLTSSPPEFIDVSPAEFAARRLVLRSRAIADTGVVGIPSACSGVLAPPSVSARQGCPREQFTIVTIALPRQQIRTPSEGYPGLSQAVQPGQWAVQVIAYEIGPSGFTIFGFNYMMTFQDKQWRLVKRISFGWIE